MSKPEPISTETIAPIKQETSEWIPEVGVTVDAFIRRQDNLRPHERENLLKETRQILSKCTPPNGAGASKTGLVVGFVQSGKTMSFTALTALARDNRYPLVIILSGTKNNLYAQSWERLRADLNVDGDNRWRNLGEPTQKETQNIAGILKAYSAGRDSTTCLIVSKKNPTRLQTLISIFSRIGAEVDLKRFPVLIIDDEGDQAGMNTLVNEGEFSPTYEKILELKRVFPSHTYVHYTATPQAPLLINISDLLSPEFAEVVTPGEDYIGGEVFFKSGNPYIKIIPQSDLANHEDSPEAPSSLIEAFQCYLIGVADAVVKNAIITGKRSMMIHPSGNIAPHKQYHRWIRALKEQWEDILSGGDAEDLSDLKSEFKKVYDDLIGTVPDISPFDKIFQELAYSLSQCQIAALNSQRDSKNFVWDGYAHLIIGGNMLDRGFTVKGLTVTYMPRGEGTAQADTIQQRARFFGYKKNYLGFCRIYLSKDLKEAYEAYVPHEKSIHTLLRKCSIEDYPLKAAKRAFFLDKDLRATRECVMDLEYLRVTGPEWLEFRRILSNPNVIDENNRLIEQFISKHNSVFAEDLNFSDKHKKATIPLRTLLGTLLIDFKAVNPYESAQMTGRLIAIETILEEAPKAMASVYLMSCGENRKRDKDKSGAINNLHQGRSGPYKGDAVVFERNSVTVQIHKILIKPDLKTTAYTLAIKVPHKKDLFIQMGSKK